MFFTLSKIIDFILLPITWLIVFSLISLLSKSAKTKKIAGISGLLILLLGSNGYVVNQIQSAYEMPQISLEQQAHYPLAVVLGGGMIRPTQEDPTRINLAESSDRCLQAALLFKSGKINRILITGGNTTIGNLKIDKSDETIYVKRLFIELGIPADSILTETQSKNTRENAIYSKKIIDSLKINTPVLLITSAYHMRRASACFEKEKIQIIPYSVDNKKKETQMGILESIIPTEKELHKLSILIHEMFGYLMYKIMGYC
jgi:uncharacterized SAM-binding protein YcdF (DUF218 family)